MDRTVVMTESSAQSLVFKISNSGQSSIEKGYQTWRWYQRGFVFASWMSFVMLTLLRDANDFLIHGHFFSNRSKSFVTSGPQTIQRLKAAGFSVKPITPPILLSFWHSPARACAWSIGKQLLVLATTQCFLKSSRIESGMTSCPECELVPSENNCSDPGQKHILQLTPYFSLDVP